MEIKVGDVFGSYDEFKDKFAVFCAENYNPIKTGKQPRDT